MSEQRPSKEMVMQKYGFSMTDKGSTAVPSNVGGFYLVADVEAMVDRLLLAKNDRIAELERHLNKAEIERAWAIGKLRGAVPAVPQPFCCDINASHPGKHRGGCPAQPPGDDHG